MTVYVVLISTKGLQEHCKVGAVYERKREAEKECERLRAANSFTQTFICEREVG